MELPPKTVSALEAMSMNRHERRRLGKINSKKIPSIINIKSVPHAKASADKASEQ